MKLKTEMQEKVYGHWVKVRRKTYDINKASVIQLLCELSDTWFWASTLNVFDSSSILWWTMILSWHVRGTQSCGCWLLLADCLALEKNSLIAFWLMLALSDDGAPACWEAFLLPTSEFLAWAFLRASLKWSFSLVNLLISRSLVTDAALNSSSSSAIGPLS